MVTVHTHAPKLKQVPRLKQDSAGKAVLRLVGAQNVHHQVLLLGEISRNVFAEDVSLYAVEMDMMAIDMAFLLSYVWKT